MSYYSHTWVDGTKKKGRDFMVPHSGTRESIIKELSANTNTGLTDKKVLELLNQYGENKLKEKKKKTWFQKFIEQFKDVMIIILLIAAAISFAIVIIERDLSAIFEPVLILLIVVLNAVMGVMQESKAEKSLEALQNLSAPHARVLRDGKVQVIDAVKLVPGDIIMLEAGDFVPADARLLTSASLKSEESALTGESVPSDKYAEEQIDENAAIGDRKNMVYSGCSITYGRSTAVVTGTGMNTEMGKIAGLLDSAVEMKTPLQVKLAQLGKYLGILAIAVCVIIFIMGIIDGMPVIEIFMTAVSLAVSAIPEGLPVIVTIVLSLGMERMAKRKAIVKRLPTVETLGCASVICSDKTGTLTQNKMTLMAAYDDVTGITEDISRENSKQIKNLLEYAVLCSDGSVTHQNGKETHIGDPTETSIIAAAYKNGIEKDKLNGIYKRVAELPFDSDRKLMSTVNEIDGRHIVITKGAYDVLAAKCINGDLNKAEKKVAELSAKALRVLAVAYKEIDDIPANPTTEDLENNLTLMGLVGMIDPPREEAKEAVAVCKKAGIKSVMITGDHVITASAIAKEIGILNDGEEAITGTELAALSEEELEKRIENISVYARVSPEDKIRVVRAWQKKDKIVSMTGDGVNDAPALKAADIGCAMGITGTDVAKGAADMTLMDDNFATIVEAVKEGRGIYDNIKKSVGFLMGTNIGEVLLVFLSMLFWKKAPLLSMQLLWINLVTDSMPAIALGTEAIDNDVMSRKPRPKNESMFAHGYGTQIILQGILFGVLALVGFKFGLNQTGEVEGGRTLAFMVMALAQIVHAFNMRSKKSIFKIGIFTNKTLNKAALISFLLVAVVLFIPPIATIFGLIILPVKLYVFGLIMSFIPVLVLEITKSLKLIR